LTKQSLIEQYFKILEGLDVPLLNKKKLANIAKNVDLDLAKKAASKVSIAKDHYLGTFKKSYRGWDIFFAKDRQGNFKHIDQKRYNRAIEPFDETKLLDGVEHLIDEMFHNATLKNEENRDAINKYNALKGSHRTDKKGIPYSTYNNFVKLGLVLRKYGVIIPIASESWMDPRTKNPINRMTVETILMYNDKEKWNSDAETTIDLYENLQNYIIFKL